MGTRGRAVVEAVRRWGWPALLGLCFLVPLSADGYVLRVLSISWLYGVLAMGVVVSYGFAGIPNMSQGTLYGVGAYVGANALSHLHLPLPLAMVAGAVGGGIVGGLLGLTALRVIGNYWWLITIAFTQVMFIVYNSWTAVTGGLQGYTGIPLSKVGPITLDSTNEYYYLGLVTLIIAYVVYARFCGSRVGLALLATRHDETAARGLGMSPGALKVASMVLAGAGAGLAGVAIDSITGYVNATTFGLDFSFSVMLFAVVGGLTSLRGAIVASVVLTYVTTQVASLVRYQLVIYGVVVLVALLVRLYWQPGGSTKLRGHTGLAVPAPVDLPADVVSEPT